jgi:hypothetical protein
MEVAAFVSYRSEEPEDSRAYSLVGGALNVRTMLVTNFVIHGLCHQWPQRLVGSGSQIIEIQPHPKVRNIEPSMFGGAIKECHVSDYL